jgi:WD40 repeat protein
MSNCVRGWFVAAGLVLLGALAWYGTARGPASGIVGPTLLTGHQHWVLSLAFAPDGTTLASAGGMGNTGEVHLWDVATGQKLKSFAGHNGPVDTIAYSPDGTLLATGSRDHTVRLWDMATGRLNATFTMEDRFISSVAFAQGGLLLLATGPTQPGHVWMTTDGEEVGGLPLYGPLAVSRGAAAVAGATSPAGMSTRCLGLDEHLPKLWELPTETSNPSSLPITSCLALAPDGHTLAIAGAENEIQLRDSRRPPYRTSLVGHADQVTCLDFSPDGAWIVSGAEDGTVRLWEVSTGRELALLGEMEKGICTVAFSPDGKLVAAGGFDRIIRLWQIAAP